MYLNCSEAMTIDTNVLAHKKILYEKNSLIFTYRFYVVSIILLSISILFIIYSVICIVGKIVNSESMATFIAYQILAFILICILGIVIMSLVCYIIIHKATDRVYIPSDDQLSTHINKHNNSIDLAIYLYPCIALFILCIYLQNYLSTNSEVANIFEVIIMIIHLYTFAASLYIIIHYFGTFTNAQKQNKKYKELYQNGLGYQIIYYSNTKSYDVNKIISNRVVRLN